MISPYIRWQHEKNWHITSYKAQEKNKTGLRIVMVDAKDDDCEYLTGHVIDGRNLYPATGYLVNKDYILHLLYVLGRGSKDNKHRRKIVKQ